MPNSSDTNASAELQPLIQQLLVCVPTLTETQLTAQLPKSHDQSGIGNWLFDCLEPIGLMRYMDWGEMFYEFQPGISGLTLLSKLDLSEYDTSFLIELLGKQYSSSELEQIIEGTFDFSTDERDYGSGDEFGLDSPDEVPLFNYLNHLLEPHNLRLIDLNFEPYLLCVHNNEQDIQKLNACLRPYNLHFDSRPAMTRRQAVERIVP